MIDSCLRCYQLRSVCDGEWNDEGEPLQFCTRCSEDGKVCLLFEGDSPISMATPRQYNNPVSEPVSPTDCRLNAFYNMVVQYQSDDEPDELHIYLNSMMFQSEQ